MKNATTLAAHEMSELAAAEKRYAQIQAALAEQNMRPACTWESGWYVTLLLDGECRKVWATDSE